jgi:hypothetical protein
MGVKEGDLDASFGLVYQDASWANTATSYAGICETKFKWELTKYTRDLIYRLVAVEPMQRRHPKNLTPSSPSPANSRNCRGMDSLLKASQKKSLRESPKQNCPRLFFS